MKFVEQGFIRFRTKVKHSKVVLLVKDSGQGVSVNKQNGLFACFQESLDLLNQGIQESVYRSALTWFVSWEVRFG